MKTDEDSLYLNIPSHEAITTVTMRSITAQGYETSLIADGNGLYLGIYSDNVEGNTFSDANLIEMLKLTDGSYNALIGASAEEYDVAHIDVIGMHTDTSLLFS